MVARTFVGLSFAVLVLSASPGSFAAGSKELSPGAREQLKKQMQVVATWAASPAVVSAVKEQNAKGPIAGLDNDGWKALKRSDPVVKAFQDCPAGKLLADKVSGGRGLYVEAFLSAAKGEKVAFVSKTTSYLHAGKPKFDVPFGTGKPWEGPVEFDESSQTYSVQISVPVLDGGKVIGVLVVGLSVASLG